MRSWQVERRRRTRQLIELGGLMVKAGVLDVTGDDRVLIYGALLWMVDRLAGDQGAQARKTWKRWGKIAFEMEQAEKATNANKAGK